MALTPVEQVKLLIGDVPTNPFYPIYTDAEVEQFLILNGQDVYKAARMAAISASFLIGSYNTREITGDIHVYNEYSSNYLAALRMFINNAATIIPENLMPWSSSIRLCNLTKIETCDGDNCVDSCEDNCSCPKCGAGETF